MTRQYNTIFYNTVECDTKKYKIQNAKIQNTKYKIQYYDPLNCRGSYSATSNNNKLVYTSR